MIIVKKTVLSDVEVSYDFTHNLQHLAKTPLDAVLREKENDKSAMRMHTFMLFFFETCFAFGLMFCISQLRQGIESGDRLIGVILMIIFGVFGSIICFQTFFEKLKFHHKSKAFEFNVGLAPEFDSKEPEAYCVKNVQNRWKSIRVFNTAATRSFIEGIVFSFENEDDAAAFKLIFG